MMISYTDNTDTTTIADVLMLSALHIVWIVGYLYNCINMKFQLTRHLCQIAL